MPLLQGHPTRMDFRLTLLHVRRKVSLEQFPRIRGRVDLPTDLPENTVLL